MAGSLLLRWPVAAMQGRGEYQAHWRVGVEPAIGVVDVQLWHRGGRLAKANDHVSPEELVVRVSLLFAPQWSDRYCARVEATLSKYQQKQQCEPSTVVGSFLLPGRLEDRIRHLLRFLAGFRSLNWRETRLEQNSNETLITRSTKGFSLVAGTLIFLISCHCWIFLFHGSAWLPTLDFSWSVLGSSSLNLLLESD